MKKYLITLACFTLTLGLLFKASAQTVKVAGIVELSGPGTTAGTNFNNGVLLAVKEINAAGGILGKKIEYNAADTQTNPGIAKSLASKAVDDGAVLVMGPVYSGSILVSMAETKKAEIPNVIGGEAAAITQQGHPYLMRCSFTQVSAMPKVARYLKETIKAKSVAVLYVNNDFGKGGRDMIVSALNKVDIKVASEISTDQGQIDFSSAVLNAKNSNADVLFVYTNEEESARLLKEIKKQGYSKPIIGETTLANDKVIELAGDAANGVIAHVGLTPDAPNQTVKEFAKKYLSEYKEKADHNAMKGYTGMHAARALFEKAGKFDAKSFAQVMHGGSISAKQYPGVLFDVTYDNNGDLDRESFFVKVNKGKTEVISTLQPIK